MSYKETEKLMNQFKLQHFMLVFVNALEADICTHAYRHIRSHTHVPTLTQAHTHTHTHAHAHAHTHTHEHTHIPTHEPKQFHETRCVQPSAMYAWFKK